MTTPHAADRGDVRFGDAARFWIGLGFVNFGGPAGQIALMHRELVDRRRWIGESSFLHGLSFANLLPGPEAQQLATYVGWRLHGLPGAVLAGTAFVVPSVFVLLALSYVATAYGDVPAVAGLLYGVQPVVVAIVVEALVRIGRRTLRRPEHVAIALATFAAATFTRIPFPAIVAAAGLAGLALGSRDPADGAPAPAPRGALRRLAILAAAFGVLWAVPFAALVAVRGAGDIVVAFALFFTQAAFVTFGGAYAVLAYVAQETVGRGWLSAEQMVQGLALAESTPGPLIMVLQHVGFVSAWNAAPADRRVQDAVLGALVTTYVTFLPSFFFILAGAPYVERLGRDPRVRAALTGITAAVVGAILSLASLFALSALLPAGNVDVLAIALALASFLALRAGLPPFVAVPLGALVGSAARIALGSIAR
ncbi:MAG TPA: chromate efflux transporter [Candidatus Limnocylindria bacterium]|nr:chromate efflux transporter [Candidatus Limnocylindria bacterium]